MSLVSQVLVHWTLTISSFSYLQLDKLYSRPTYNLTMTWNKKYLCQEVKILVLQYDKHFQHLHRLMLRYVTEFTSPSTQHTTKLIIMITKSDKYTRVTSSYPPTVLQSPSLCVLTKCIRMSLNTDFNVKYFIFLTFCCNEADRQDWQSWGTGMWLLRWNKVLHQLNIINRWDNFYTLHVSILVRKL